MKSRRNFLSVFLGFGAVAIARQAFASRGDGFSAGASGGSSPKDEPDDHGNVIVGTKDGVPVIGPADPTWGKHSPGSTGGNQGGTSGGGGSQGVGGNDRGGGHN